jgi:hypothetical protein
VRETAVRRHRLNDRLVGQDGATESAPTLYSFGGWGFRFSHRRLAWLVILGLGLLKPNRRREIWFQTASGGIVN